MQDAQDDLGRQEAVGDHAHQERADHPRDRTDRVGPAKVLGPKANRFQIVGARDVPRSPNKELNEHHDAEARGGQHGFFLPVTNKSGIHGKKTPTFASIGVDRPRWSPK